VPRVQADDGVELAYDVQGEGPVNLFFLHGWAGSRSYFDAMVERLDLTGLRVIRADLRGHGESSPTEEGFTHEQIAADALTVADAAGADELITVGFSMSARFVQYLPLVAPKRVRGQVLIAGCPTGEIPLPQEMLDDWYSREGDAERMIELTQSFMTKPVGREVLEPFGRDAAKIRRPALEQTMVMCTSMSFTDRIGEVDTPTLVVGGAHDPVFTPDVLRDGVVAPLKRARLVFVDAGHEVPIEDPDTTALLVAAFVAGSS
jgi:non-heme chloroperoxidase